MKSRALDTLGKNTGGFGFLSTFFDLLGNREFKRAEISSLYTDAETEHTSFWRALSAVGTQHGEELVANVLHFIDGVADPDTCRVPQLQSMAASLGQGVDGWSSYCSMPVELQKVVDFLSIKREALLRPDIAKPEFVSLALSGGEIYEAVDPVSSLLAGTQPDGSFDYSATSKLLPWRRAFDIATWRRHWAEAFPDTSAYWDASATMSAQAQIDAASLSSLVETLVSSMLFSKLTQTYSDKLGLPVYVNLSNYALLSNFELPDYNAAGISAYKISVGLPNEFDEKTEADLLASGQTASADYTSRELCAIGMEMARRDEPLYPSQLETRYRYYREKEVQEWARYAERETSFMSSFADLASLDRYSLDPAYYQTENRVLSSHVFVQTPEGSVSVQLSSVAAVAKRVAAVVESIRESREQLKLACQKLAIRGSQQHLKWLVREYLTSVAKSAGVPLSVLDSTDVGIVRYYDLNRYFDVSSESDQALLSDSELSSEVSHYLPSLNPKPSSSLTSQSAVSLRSTLPSDVVNPLLLEAKTSDTSASLGLDNIGEAAASAFYANRLSVGLSGYDQRDEAIAKRMRKFLAAAADYGAETTFDYFGKAAIWDAPQLSAEAQCAATEMEEASCRVAEAWSRILDRADLVPGFSLADFCSADQPLSKQLSSIAIFVDGLAYRDKLAAYQSGILDCIASAQSALVGLDMAMDRLPLSGIREAAERKASAVVAAAAEVAERAALADTFPAQKALAQLTSSCYQMSAAVVSAASALAELYPESHQHESVDHVHRLPLAGYGSSAADQISAIASSELGEIASRLPSGEDIGNLVEELSGIETSAAAGNLLSTIVADVSACGGLPEHISGELSDCIGSAVSYVPTSDSVSLAISSADWARGVQLAQTAAAFSVSSVVGLQNWLGGRAMAFVSEVSARVAANVAGLMDRLPLSSLQSIGEFSALVQPSQTLSELVRGNLSAAADQLQTIAALSASLSAYLSSQSDALLFETARQLLAEDEEAQYKLFADHTLLSLVGVLQERDTFEENWPAGLKNWFEQAKQFAVLASEVVSKLASEAHVLHEKCSAALVLQQKAAGMSGLPAKAADAASRTAAACSVLSAAGDWLDLSQISLDSLPDSLTAWQDEAIHIAAEDLSAREATSLAKSRIDMFRRYCAIQSKTPWYSLANSWHPSYLAHPIVQNFARVDDQQAIPESLYSSLEDVRSEMLSASSRYVGGDGLLLDVWDSPLRYNQPWLTRYEEEATHESRSGKKSPCVAYDGVAYPPALADFISGKIFPRALSSFGFGQLYAPDTGIAFPPFSADDAESGSVVSGDTIVASFAQALNGLCADYSQYRKHVSWNSWYGHLDLDADSCTRIASQLETLSAQLQTLSCEPGCFEVVSYGLDSFGNSWTLLRDTARGWQTIWVKLAGHPIGFPAFAVRREENASDSLLSCSAVDTGFSISSLSCVDSLDTGFPVGESIAYLQVLGFEIAENGRSIAIAFCKKDSGEATVAVFSISESQTAKPSVKLAKLASSWTLLDVAGGHLLKLFELDGKLGALGWWRPDTTAAQVCVSGAYASADGVAKKIRPLSLSVDIATELAADARDGKLFFAWPRYVEEDEQLRDYLGAAASADYVLQTIGCKIGLDGSTLVKTGSRAYAVGADIGYFGLLPVSASLDSNYVNDFTGVDYAYEKQRLSGVCYFQIEAPSKSKAIDFYPVAAARLREGYSAPSIDPHLVQTAARAFYAANYLDTRKLESGSGLAPVASDTPAYTPEKFSEVLSGQSVALRETETGISRESLSSVASGYIVPLLWWSEPVLQEDGKTTKPSAVPTAMPFAWTHGCVYSAAESADPDSCVLRLADGLDLSVSWKPWTDLNGKRQIQLDFNTAMFNTPQLSAWNGSNQLQLFLNLEKAGDAGTIKIYKQPVPGAVGAGGSALELDFTLVGSYYVKNLSDSKPKFAAKLLDSEDADVLILEQAMFNSAARAVEPGYAVAETGKNIAVARRQEGY